MDAVYKVLERPGQDLITWWWKPRGWADPPAIALTLFGYRTAGYDPTRLHCHLVGGCREKATAWDLF